MCRLYWRISDGCTVLVYRRTVMFSANAIFWSLSTLAQVLVTLVAFVGLVALWKLDGLRGTRAEAREVLLPALRSTHFRHALRHTGFSTDDESNETLVRMADHIQENKGEIVGFSIHEFRPPRINRFIEYGRLLAAAREHATNLKTSLRRLVHLGFGGTVLAVAVLPYTAQLADGSWWPLMLTLSLSLGAVALGAFYYAWQTLRIGMQDLADHMSDA